MLLTISTTYQPATDLGYLLHKRPGRVQTFPQKFGQAHIFYPEISQQRCTIALLLDIDSVLIVRNHSFPASNSFALGQYVNDRPYVASSLLSVAIADLFGSALNGRSKEREELVTQTLPLQATIDVVPSRGGEDILHRLFEPLGYHVFTKGMLLDEKFPEWGASPYFSLKLEGEVRLQSLLQHIYVLLPVLDDDKHYWVGDDEVEKLLQRGEGWLAQHPEREMIVRRYLKHRRNLTETALSRLVEEDIPDFAAVEERRNEEEASVEKQLGLHQQRLAAVLAVLHESGATRVLDLGCGDGKLLEHLLQDRRFSEIVGIDVSARSLEFAEARLRLKEQPDAQRARIRLLQSSLLYRDKRLSGYQAAALVEVIEHIEPGRMKIVERILFEQIAPKTLVLTTPNREYNRLWPNLPAGKFRHHDHHFEWTRAEFQNWAIQVANQYNYQVRFEPVGPENSKVGAPTQMGVFTR
jgi:3' terminal RNA ribose 2'-O-methyltransferase Hen1